MLVIRGRPPKPKGYVFFSYTGNGSIANVVQIRWYQIYYPLHFSVDNYLFSSLRRPATYHTLFLPDLDMEWLQKLPLVLFSILSPVKTEPMRALSYLVRAYSCALPRRLFPTHRSDGLRSELKFTLRFMETYCKQRTRFLTTERLLLKLLRKSV